MRARPPTLFSALDLWIQRAAAGTMVALALALVGLGLALYVPH